jgi:hypothetical protein
MLRAPASGGLENEEPSTKNAFPTKNQERISVFRLDQVGVYASLRLSTFCSPLFNLSLWLALPGLRLTLLP